MSETLVREMFRTIDARDWARLAVFFTEDVIYERPGYEPLRGREALVHFYCEVRVIVAGRHDLWRVISGADAAACWGRFSGTSRDGQTLEERFADVYTLRAGKVATRTTHFFRPAI